MRAIVIIAGLALTGCEGVYTPPNVFNLAKGDAYSKLARVDTDDEGLNWMKGVRAKRSPTSSIKWIKSGITCAARFIELDPQKTQIDVSCEGGSMSDGAAAGMKLAMVRKQVIEFVDSGLKGRPYDKQLAKGATASGWPADKVKHDNIFEAQSKALAMEAEMKRGAGGR